MTAYKSIALLFSALYCFDFADHSFTYLCYALFQAVHFRKEKSYNPTVNYMSGTKQVTDKWAGVLSGALVVEYT